MNQKAATHSAILHRNLSFHNSKGVTNRRILITVFLRPFSYFIVQERNTASLASIEQPITI